MIENSKINNDINFEINKFIYKLLNEDKTITYKIHDLFKKVLWKFNFTYDYNCATFINKWLHWVTFDYYEDELFDWCLDVYATKLLLMKNRAYVLHKAEEKNSEYILSADFYSSMLDKTLEKGSKINRKIYSNILDLDAISSKKQLSICVSSKSLTIYWKNIEDSLIWTNILGRLWPKQKLRLENFCCWTN